METKSQFAERLRSARLMKGYSLQDLADVFKNSLTRQALHRYEKGEVLPDADRIALLSEALDVSPDYFFRNTQVELGKIEYRKLDRLPQKEANAIKEKTREYLSRYIELEDILGLAHKFEHHFRDFEVISEYEQVNRAAELLRKKWKLGKGPIFNIVELLEDKFIKVVKLDVNEDFDGLQTFVNDSIPVVAYNVRKSHKPDRIRFTLLHELAHLLLKFEKMPKKQEEILCHQFAGAMLLPEETIIAELGKTRSKLSILELANIKRQYGISMQAIAMRARDCGIISEQYTRQFFELFKQMGWMMDEPYDYEGVEESNRFEQLLFRALIEEEISLSKAASLKNISLADFRKQYQLML